MRPIGKNSKNRNAGPAVVCDFDDTLVLENVAEMLLTEFGGLGWREYQRQNSEQRISLKEYQELAFLTVKVGRAEMQELVKERATLRPQFRELYAYCQARDIPMAIATMGLDFYVEALLEREEMSSIDVFAATTKFVNGSIEFGYNFSSDLCWQPGNCKCVAMNRYRQQGHAPIIFAGDGKSDICPADRADAVFALRFLEENRVEQGLPYVRLDDFSSIIDYLVSLEADPSSASSCAANGRAGAGG